MALVTATRYNNLRQDVYNVLGIGTGDSGYGQSATSSTVSVAQLVEATNINNLYEDIRKCYKHQNGGNPASNQLQEVVAADLIVDNDTTTYKGWDQYEALALAIATNRLTAHINQIQVQGTSASKTRSSSWNGTITHLFTVTFTDEDERRYFFNSGGTIRIAASVTGGSAKDSSWNTMLAQAGTISFGANSTTQASGDPQGTVGSAVGNYQLTGTDQYIYQRIDGGGGAYAANDYTIEARTVSNTQLMFTMEYRDEAAGNIDETVSNATATIDSGTAYIDVIGTTPAFAIDGTSTL